MSINDILSLFLIIITGLSLTMVIIFVPVMIFIKYLDKKTNKIVPLRVLLVIPWIIFLLGIGVLITKYYNL